MKLQVSAGKGSAAGIRATGTRNRNVEGVVPDSRLAVIAGPVHREAVPIGVVHACAAGESHAGGFGDQPERVDRQAVHLQARSVVDVLELAVKPPGPSRTGVESESAVIAAGPELAATGHERVARLVVGNEEPA